MSYYNWLYRWRRNILFQFYKFQHYYIRFTYWAKKRINKEFKVSHIRADTYYISPTPPLVGAREMGLWDGWCCPSSHWPSHASPSQRLPVAQPPTPPFFILPCLSALSLLTHPRLVSKENSCYCLQILSFRDKEPISVDWTFVRYVFYWLGGM